MSTEQYILRKLKALNRAVCCLQENGGTGGGDQIFQSETPLTGEAPEGYIFGIDTSTGTTYYVNEFNQWTTLPSSGDTLLDTISDFTTFDDSSTERLSVLDEERGGDFVKYSGTQVVDNGIIFEDASGQKWKRQITENYINVKWYPVVESVAMDAIWAQILTAAKNKENIPFPRIYFPANKTGYYRFANTIIIDARVEIFGDGASSWLRWNTNVPGIVTNYITSRGSILRDLLLDGASSSVASGVPLGSNWSTIQYGIEPKDIIYCSNLTIRYWAGSGIRMYGAAGVSNINNSILSNCYFSQNRLHGLYIQGPDANAIQVIKCDATSNGGVGFNDKSFLGNHYLHNHSASNGSPELQWQRGLVKVGTDVYACIVDGTVGIEPGVTVGWQSNWILTGKAWSGYGPVAVYDATKLYYQVCAYNLEGVNQYGTFIGNYAEADQADSFIANRNVLVGINFALRVGSASSLQSNGALYSEGFWAGNPGDNTSNRSFIATRGVGVTKGGGTGLVFGWDSTRNLAEFKSISGVEGSGTFRITSPTTVGANVGRTAVPGGYKPWFPSGILLNYQTNRTGATKLLDCTITANPSTAGSDIGDIFLASTTSPNLSVPPETVVLKYFNTTASSLPKLCSIKGFMEDILTNITGTFAIMTDYNIALNKGILYNIHFTGSNATDDCILHREILMVNRAGTVTIVDNTAIRPDYIPGTFSTTAITLGVSGGDDISLTITGLPAGTYGKVHVKRINY